MTLVQIKMFLATVKYGNFARAALKLYISSPAIAKQIASLEKELGFPLFIRTTRSMELTEQGNIMLECFQKFIADFNYSTRLANDYTNKDKKTLTLGRPEQFTPYILDSAILKFQSENPDISIVQQCLSMKELYQELYDGKLDAVLGFEDEIDLYPELEYRVLLQAEYQLLLSEDHPLANLEVLDKEKNYGKVLKIRENHGALNAILDESLESFYSNHKVIEVSTIESLLYNVGKNVGIGFADDCVYIDPEYRVKRINLGIKHYLIIAYRKSEKRSLTNSFVNYIFNFSNGLEKLQIK